MGIYGSKSIITIPEAKGLIGLETWEKIQSAYKRISDSNVLDSKAFCKYFLSGFPMIPSLLADQLFCAFDMAGRGVIGEQEFCCGLAIMLRGSPDLQFHLLFYVYEYRHSGFIEMEQLRRLLDSIYSSEEAAAIDAAVGSLFVGCQRERRLDDHEFNNAVMRVHQKQPYALRPLTNWFKIVCRKVMEEPDEGIIKQEKLYNPEIALISVTRKYRLHEYTVSVLRQRHNMLRRKGRSGKLDREVWGSMVDSVLHPDLAGRCFSSFTKGISLQWTVAEFVQFCCTIIYGKQDDHGTMMFGFFDEDGDGILSIWEIELMLESLAWHHLHREKLLPHQHSSRASRRTRRLSIDSSSAHDHFDSENILIGLEKIGCAADVASCAEALLVQMRAQNEKFVGKCEAIEEDKVPGEEEGKKCTEGLSLAGFMAWLSMHPGRTQVIRDLCFIACVECGAFPVTPTQEDEVISEIIRQYDALHNSESDGCKYGTAGTNWNLIYAPWWQSWRAYISENNTRKMDSEPSRPGVIDNWPLMGVPGTERVHLKRTLRIHKDFIVIPPRAWAMLQKWYDGGPTIERSVALMENHHVLDLWPYRLRIGECDARGRLRPQEFDVLFSQVGTGQQLLEYLAKKRKVEPDTARIWNYYHSGEDQWQKQVTLAPNKTLRQSEIVDNQLLLLEISLQDGTWPRSQLQSILEAAEEERLGGAPESSSTNRDSSEIGDGLVGLVNLGNTCYISSSIQCVSHTPFLTEFFLSGQYLNHINPNNQLGTGGELARIYAQLVRELWGAGPSRAVNPKLLKSVIGRFNEQFAGHDQHDAQELLDVLVNGLHEDLNQITVKPYIEQPDSDGRSDDELADIWWANHLKRDLSVVLKLFAGQFKSLLTCGTCGYASARFEPFTFLQLPLPEESTRSIDVILIPLDGSILPVRCRVSVPKDGTVRDVTQALCELCNCPEENLNAQTEDEESSDDQTNKIIRACRSMKLEPDWLVVVEMAMNKIVSIISLERRLTCVRENDTLHVYQLQPIYQKVVAKSRNDTENSNLTENNQDGRMAPPGLKSEGANRNQDGNAVLYKPRCMYYRVLHRSLEPQGIYFLNKFKLQVLGTPLICTASIDQPIKARDLYDSLKKRFCRFVKDQHEEHLSSRNDSNLDVSRVSANNSPPRAIRKSLSKNGKLYSELEVNEQGGVTYGHSERLAAGPLNKWGFRLRYVNSMGNACSRCNWLTGCLGCFIPPDDKAVDLRDADVIAVDWHMTVMCERYDTTQATATMQHPSVELAIQQESQPLNLVKCLETFSAEEVIPEGYCSNCKALRETKKKMGLWRLPPVLVIQLKRFQYTQYSRRKLRNLVEFPIKGLDLSPFVLNNHFSSAQSVSESSSNHSSPANSDQPEVKFPPLKGNEGGLYDLYAVVHHLGALSSGHYVASVKSQANGRWHYFNDHQISEMEENELVNQSAYILFYVRRDLQDINFNVIDRETAGTASLERYSKNPASELDMLTDERITGRCSLM